MSGSSGHQSYRYTNIHANLHPNGPPKTISPAGYGMSNKQWEYDASTLNIARNQVKEKYFNFSNQAVVVWILFHAYTIITFFPYRLVNVFPFSKIGKISHPHTVAQYRLITATSKRFRYYNYPFQKKWHVLQDIFSKFRTKKLAYLIFSKSSGETFCCSEDKFRGYFKLQRRVKTACSEIHNWANGMWNQNTKSNKSESNTFKFHLLILSSNDWTARLIAINLR